MPTVGDHDGRRQPQEGSVALVRSTTNQLARCRACNSNRASLSLPPTTAVGSSLACASTVAISDVVVVLPVRIRRW